MWKNKKVSIIIPVYVKTDRKFIEECIGSIRKNSRLKHQIILVVNPTNDIQKFEYLNVDVLLANKEQGQCHANNLAVKQAKYDWILIVDYDTVFPKNWEKILDNREKDTVLAFNCIENNTRGVAPGFVFYDCGNIDNFNEEKFEKKAKELSLTDRAQLSPITEGFCYPFLIEKKHYLTVEGFDTDYDPWGSNCDSDFEYKCMLLGLDMKRHLGIYVYHFSQTSPTFDDTDEMDYFRKGNTRIFEQKWQLARARSPQIWWAEFTIPRSTAYKPKWMNQVSDKHMSVTVEGEWECSRCRFVNKIVRKECRECKSIK